MSGLAAWLLVELWRALAYCAVLTGLRQRQSEEALLRAWLATLCCVQLRGAVLTMLCAAVLCCAVLCCAVLCCAVLCRAQAEMEEALVDEELQRLLNDYVESRVREALASEHVQASLAERLKVGCMGRGVGGEVAGDWGGAGGTEGPA
jgi:hypothetical protein